MTFTLHHSDLASRPARLLPLINENLWTTKPKNNNHPNHFSTLCVVDRF